MTSHLKNSTARFTRWLSSGSGRHFVPLRSQQRANWLGLTAVLWLSLWTSQAYALSCSAGGTKEGSLPGGGSVCYCDLNFQGKDYTQAVSPVGMGIPESSEAAEIGGELAGIALDEGLGGGSAFLSYGTMVYGGSKSGGSIKYRDAVNTKICSDASCNSYITPSQYKSGVRYYFQNTSAGGGKQVFSCEWYGSAWLGQYYFKNARMDVPGVVDIMSPSIQYRYYARYTAQNASGAIVPNQVTATDAIDANPVVTCTPALTSYLPVGKNTISCTAKDASNNVSGTVSFVTEVLKANQWVTFYPINNIELGESAPALNVSLSSSLTPVYSASGPCSVNSSGVVSVSGTGNCAITATHPGNGYFNEASDGTQRFDINPARTVQTITFDTVPEKTADDPSFTLGVTGGGSGNPVKLTTRLSPNVCFVALPNTLYVFGAGTCKVEAFQDGNASFKPASAMLEFEVKKAVVSLSLAEVGEKAYGNPAFRVRATSSVPPYLLNYSTTGVCSNSGNLITLTGVGTCTVTVAVAATSAYDATSATLDISVLKGNQLINFPALDRASVSNAQLTLASTGGTSGEPIVYSATGTCSVSGDVVTFTEGLCEVTANQAGNTNYNAAAPVSRSLVFAKANQTINFPAISSSSISGGQFPVSATGGASGNPVTYSAAGCSISGTTVTITPGTLCNVTASQAGNVDYNAAADVTQSIQISASGAIVTNCNSTAVTGVPVGDCQALLALYNSTGGANWTTKTNWNTNSAVSTWYTVQVYNGRVSSLYLNSNNLSGTLPSELGNLTGLIQLGLMDNNLTGTIPPELGQLPSLGYVYLRGNKLSGEIPSQLGNLSALSDLSLDGNQLSGQIPVALANLSQLRTLSLANNKLNGAIPSQLGNAPLLSSLNLSNNQLSGAIPVELSQLNLSELLLSNNRLTGTIPDLSKIPLPYFPGMPPNLSLGYNALTDETSGTATARQADWRDTQTAPPTGITANVLSATSIALSWTPMLYQSDSGYYQVQYATTAGGPYDLAGVTADKTATGYTVNGLKPGTTYYFVVTGYTGDTIDVTSDPSAEISATTTALNHTQTLTFPTLGNLTPNDTQILNASASSGLAVSYSVSGPCSVTGNEVTATGVGTCTVTASQAGNGQYSAATSAERSFEIAKLAQAIDFPFLQETAPGSSQTLTATASSGLTVNYSASGNCTVSGDQVTANDAGMCTVTASQAGDAQYNAASDVVRSFDMSKIAQSITFAALPDISYGQPAPTLSATVTPATLSVEYSASGVCSVTGGVLSVNSAGTCTVTASQPGDTLHAAATPVSHSFTVTPSEGALAFEPIDSPSYANLNFTVTAKRDGATGAITYTSITPETCSVSGNTVNILQAGLCQLTAEQAADVNTPVAQASVEVVINPVALSVWVADASIQEGSPLPAFGATSYEGFVRSETETVLSGTLAFTTTAPTPVIAGSYDINASGLTSPNYTISYLPGKLTVGGIGLMVTEMEDPVVEGQSGVISVKLTGQPGGIATVTLTPDNFVSLGASAAGQPITLSFDANNWDTVQNVTVAPVDDTIPHGTKWSFIKATLNGSYSGVTEMTVRTIIYDNDPGVVIQPYSETLNLIEGGTAGQYTLRLSSIPIQAVTMTLTPDTRLQTDVTTVTFAADETALQMKYIQVTAIDDSVFSNVPALITHSITTGDGVGYTNALAIAPVTVNITDNDPGVVIKPSSISAVEGGATGSYSISLNSAPVSPVTVLLSYDSKQLAVSQSQLIFAADATASTAQTITVTAIDDSIVEGAHSSSIHHSIKIGDGASYLESNTLESVSVAIGDKAVAPPLPPPPSPPPVVEVPAPSNLQISSTVEGNVLVWNAAKDSHGYYIYRSDKKDQVFASTAALTWTDTVRVGITECDRAYTYSVRNMAGGVRSNEVTGTIPCVLEEPKEDITDPDNPTEDSGGVIIPVQPDVTDPNTDATDNTDTTLPNTDATDNTDTPPPNTDATDNTDTPPPNTDATDNTDTPPPNTDGTDNTDNTDNMDNTENPNDATDPEETPDNPHSGDSETELDLSALIRMIPGFENLSVEQLADGELLFTAPDKSVMAAFVILSNERPTNSQTPSFKLSADGSLVLSLSNGVILRTVPGLMPKAPWESVLAALGIKMTGMQSGGNWLFEGHGIGASMWPEWNIQRVADETPLGLSYTPMPCDSGAVSLTFEHDGMKYQQNLHPALADMAMVQTYLQQNAGVQLEPRGQGELGVEGTAIMLYPHWSLVPNAGSGSFNISKDSDKDFSLSYPNGMQQSTCITSPLESSNAESTSRKKAQSAPAVEESKEEPKADYERVMNWAEAYFSEILPAPAEATQWLDPYQARYYPANGTYLGYHTTDGHFYLYQPELYGENPYLVGKLSELLFLAQEAGF
ncbi:MBG domain-containing protein [Thioflexithrix psekupsensis]|uniref:Fibronectin type-III domain-containing protein n=1 Tax=Thioflexithrix psekupsensis TaxID=1570016 RepID=A0A251X5T9_9GAMM|nr:MBG domain-containing protein [Thioflexithrix psekupsensis]OUD12297.1 hypothetical protein TPSD3_14360 [Thioflexithrix psekupsensis]